MSTSTQKVTKKTYLPNALITDIKALYLPDKTKTKVISTLSFLQKRSYEEHGICDHFISISKNIWRKNFGNDYFKIKEILLKEKIMDCNFSYKSVRGDFTIIGNKGNVSIFKNKQKSVKNGNDVFTYKSKVIDVSKSNNNIYCNKDSDDDSSCSMLYRISQRYYDISLLRTSFEVNSSVSTFYASALLSADQLINSQLSAMKELKIDCNVLRNIIEKEVSQFTLDKYLINESIERKFFSKVYFGKNRRKKDGKYAMRISRARQIAKEKDLDLIQDKDRLYIMKKEYFLIMKKYHSMIAYLDIVLKLENRDFFANIKENSNDRLNSTITNMPNFMMKEVMEQNKLVSLDLSNSQFAIFCHIVKDTELAQCADFKEFAESATSGKLYELIMEKLEISERSIAKQSMFELLFSKHTLRSKMKTKLKKAFPNVVKWIDDYKQENGYNQFAIMLQKKEANIFLQNIYKKIKSQKTKIFCLTKHDSLIVKEKDKERAMQVIEEVFSNIDFKGKIKIE